MRHFDWEALVPSDVALDQIAWERRRVIARAHNAGAKLADIAQKLGVSYTRVYQLNRLGQNETVSPVERWLKEIGSIGAVYDEVKRHAR